MVLTTRIDAHPHRTIHSVRFISIVNFTMMHVLSPTNGVKNAGMYEKTMKAREIIQAIIMTMC